jgi:clan AA aspartic protease
MIVTEEPQVGRFSVEVELSSHKDILRVEDGHLLPDQVRRIKIRGVVDTGATRLVIPESVVQQLGLESSSNTKVRYADGHTAERAMVKDLHLAYGGRESVFTAIVEPGRDSALIGAIVMEELDFLADCVTQRLVPRDPNQIVSEIE